MEHHPPSPNNSIVFLLGVPPPGISSSQSMVGHSQESMAGTVAVLEGYNITSLCSLPWRSSSQPSPLKLLTCRIFIWFTMVLLPDFPAPSGAPWFGPPACQWKSEERRERIWGWGVFGHLGAWW